jgi:hypothetical protein
MGEVGRQLQGGGVRIGEEVCVTGLNFFVVFHRE